MRKEISKATIGLLATIGLATASGQIDETRIAALWAGSATMTKFGDIDGNGVIDAVFVAYTASGFEVFLVPNIPPNATSAQNFTPYFSLSQFSFDYFSTIETADLDGDGDDDLVVTGISSLSVFTRSIWAILSGPTPTPILVATVANWISNESIAPWSGSMALADVDGDGAVEVTLAHRPVLTPTTYRSYSVSAVGSQQIDSFTAPFLRLSAFRCPVPCGCGIDFRGYFRQPNRWFSRPTPRPFAGCAYRDRATRRPRRSEATP